MISRQQLVCRISEACLDATAEKIADVVLELLSEPEKHIPEWERRLICQLEDEGTISDHCSDCVDHIKDFIRQEFVKMGQEIIQPDNGIRELAAYPADAYRQGIYDMKYKVNEALRKRGVE